MKIVKAFAVSAVVAAMSVQPVFAQGNSRGNPNDATSGKDFGACASTWVSEVAWVVNLVNGDGEILFELGSGVGIGSLQRFSNPDSARRGVNGTNAQDIIFFAKNGFFGTPPGFGFSCEDLVIDIEV